MPCAHTNIRISKTGNISSRTHIPIIGQTTIMSVQTDIQLGWADTAAGKQSNGTKLRFRQTQPSLHGGMQLG